MASAAAICRPVPTPPAEHRRRRDRVDDLGPEHHAADVARVAAALGALRDDDVDAGRLVRAPRRRRRRRTGVGPMDLVDDLGGGVRARWRWAHLRMAERDLDLQGRRRRGPPRSWLTG
jgi:hypothetical protein